jgi:predicted NBD/HSP70 family sugar kinase
MKNPLNKKTKNIFKKIFLLDEKEDEESKEKIESALDRLDKAIEELQQISQDVRINIQPNTKR